MTARPWRKYDFTETPVERERVRETDGRTAAHRRFNANQLAHLPCVVNNSSRSERKSGRHAQGRDRSHATYNIQS